MPSYTLEQLYAGNWVFCLSHTTSVVLQIVAERIKEPSNEGTETKVAESLLPQVWEDLEVFLNHISYSCLENSFEDLSNVKDFVEDFKVLFPSF